MRCMSLRSSSLEDALQNSSSVMTCAPAQELGCANRPQKLRPSSVTDQMERGGARAWKGRRTVSEICSGWKSTTHLCGWLMGVASKATVGKVDDAVKLSAAQMAQKS